MPASEDDSDGEDHPMGTDEKLEEWKRAFARNEGKLFKKKEAKHVPEEFRRPKGRKGHMDAFGADTAIKEAMGTQKGAQP